MQSKTITANQKDPNENDVTRTTQYITRNHPSRPTYKSVLNRQYVTVKL